jgi:hypothetical protein
MLANPALTMASHTHSMASVVVRPSRKSRSKRRSAACAGTRFSGAGAIRARGATCGDMATMHPAETRNEALLIAKASAAPMAGPRIAIVRPLIALSALELGSK